MFSLCLDGFCLGALVSPINPKHVQQAKSHVVLTKTSNIFSDRLPQWTKGLVKCSVHTIFPYRPNLYGYMKTQKLLKTLISINMQRNYFGLHSFWKSD